MIARLPGTGAWHNYPSPLAAALRYSGVGAQEGPLTRRSAPTSPPRERCWGHRRRRRVTSPFGGEVGLRSNPGEGAFGALTLYAAAVNRGRRASGKPLAPSSGAARHLLPQGEKGNSALLLAWGAN
jgi:hypothetical protein